VLPVSSIAGQAFAAGAVANVMFGAWGDPVFRGLTIVSMLSALNSNHLMASRVLFAMSRDGLVTSRAAIVNDGGTPTMALLASTIVARWMRSVIAAAYPSPTRGANWPSRWSGTDSTS